MRAASGQGDQEAVARAILQEVGRPPSELLRALRIATSLSLDELGVLAGRTAFTLRRWQKLDEVAVPAVSACAIEDLRAIIAMLIDAGHSKRSITSFLRSRNPGLGRDRPLDSLRSNVAEFARVEHVTQCFIDGIAPEQGRHVLIRPMDDSPVQIADGGLHDPDPRGAGEPDVEDEKQVKLGV